MSFWWFIIGFFALACIIFLAMLLSDFPPDGWGGGSTDDVVWICTAANPIL